MRGYCLLYYILYVIKTLNLDLHDKFRLLSKIWGFNNYACWRLFSLKRIDWEAVGCFLEVCSRMVHVLKVFNSWIVPA